MYALTVTVTLGLLGLTLFIQLNNGVNALIQSKASLTEKQILFAERGTFYDRNGVSLVANSNGYELYINLAEWSKLTVQLQAETLALLKSINVDVVAFQQKIDQGLSLKYAQVLVGKTLAEDEANKLGLQKFAAIGVNALKLRRYIYGPLYAHIIGYTGLPNEQEVASGLNSNSQAGKYRLEDQYDSWLRGVDGHSSFGQTYQLTPPVNGGNLQLTIDHNWQASLYKLLGRQTDVMGARAGAGMITDTQTGEVIAYVSYPSYDPNALSYQIDSKAYGNWLQDVRKPLLDKVIGIQSSTGSTFKIFSAYTLLTNGIIDAQTKLRSTGCIKLGNNSFCEFGKRKLGLLDITTALAKSSNIFFCTNLMAAEANLGIQRIVDDLAQFGFGTKTNIGFAGEASGVLPGPEYKQTTFKQSWYPGDTCNMSIGQGMFVATTAQMAMATQSLTNGGKLFKPQIIKAEITNTGAVEKNIQPELVRSIALDPNTQALIMDGMYKVAHMPGGTAYAHLNKVPGNVRIKTGSAEAADEKGRPRVHSWSVGSFEHNGRNYTFALHMFFGGGGGYLNPVVRDFVNCVYSNFRGGCK